MSLSWRFTCRRSIWNKNNHVKL